MTISRSLGLTVVLRSPGSIDQHVCLPTSDGFTCALNNQRGESAAEGVRVVATCNNGDGTSRSTTAKISRFLIRVCMVLENHHMVIPITAPAAAVLVEYSASVAVAVSETAVAAHHDIWVIPSYGKQ